MNRFQSNQVFLLAGNDVMVFTPLLGAAGDLYLRFLKRQPTISRYRYFGFLGSSVT